VRRCGGGRDRRALVPCRQRLRSRRETTLWACYSIRFAGLAVRLGSAATSCLQAGISEEAADVRAGKPELFADLGECGSLPVDRVHLLDWVVGAVTRW
jgi:hypothetical protein